MVFFVIGSALINIPHVVIDDKLFILIMSSVAEVVLFIGMVLSKFEKGEKLNIDIENPLNEVETQNDNLDDTINNNNDLPEIRSVVELGPPTYYTEQGIINMSDIKPSTTPNGPFESYIVNELPPTIPSVSTNNNLLQ
jgi:hypothetical protein